MQKVNKKQKQLITQEAYQKNLSKCFSTLNSNAKIQHIFKDEIWLIQNVLSKQSCDELIQITQQQGYSEALLRVGKSSYGFINTNIRDSMRTMIDDVLSAKLLYQFLKKKVPVCQQGAYFYGVNQRFRFLKYEHQNKFAKHVDGRFSRNSKEVSVMTLQIYLNDVQKAGSTRFYHQDFKDEQYDVFPKVGNVVVFKQKDWYHSGQPVEQGLKYTLRTDLMYKWLSQNEIEAIKDQQCGVCKNKITIKKRSNCAHKYIICLCPQYSTQLKKRKKNTCGICKKV